MVLFAIGWVFPLVFMRKSGITKAEGHFVVLEGSVSGIVLSTVVFSAKYFFSYKRAIDNYSASYIIIENAIYSIMTGISTGILTVRLLELNKKQ
jgi:hypothetical protein